MHERLWAIKYIILLVLFGVSLESMATAERLAEVEPFKTAITLRVRPPAADRGVRSGPAGDQPVYPQGLRRYVCPLGAALAMPTRLRLFDWLKRRKVAATPANCAPRNARSRRFIPMVGSMPTNAITASTAR